MSILIVGSEGAQGKRYSAILKHLGISCFRVDLGHQFGLVEAIQDKIDGIIITTPTNTHVDIIDNYLRLKKPILVEKPVCKDIETLKALAVRVKEAQVSLSMVFQYRHLVQYYVENGESYYNYFRHGDDGLVWDCLQIIALSLGKVTLMESSPVWTCIINGKGLDIADMDKAYVKEIQSWLVGEKKQTMQEIIDIHEKVSDYEKAFRQ